MRYQSVYFSSLLQVQWKSNKFLLLIFCCWWSPPLFVYLFCFKISKLNSKPLCLLHYALLAVNETSTYQFKNQSKIVVWSGRLFEKYPLFVLELAYWQCFGLPSKWAFGAATIYPDSPSFLFSHLHLFNFFLHLFSQPTTLSIQIHLLFSHLHHFNPVSQHTPLLPIQIWPFSYFLTNISSTFSRPIHIHNLLFSYQQS